MFSQLRKKERTNKLEHVNIFLFEFVSIGQNEIFLLLAIWISFLYFLPWFSVYLILVDGEDFNGFYKIIFTVEK